LCSYVLDADADVIDALLYPVESSKDSVKELEKAVVEKFKATAAVRPLRWISKLKKGWDNQRLEERLARATALIAVVDNIGAISNADYPAKAIQGILNLIGSIRQLAGPTGQIINTATMFISSILNLFGETKKPKPFSMIVREQIDEALEAFYEKIFDDEAESLLRFFEELATLRHVCKGWKCFVGGVSKTVRQCSECLIDGSQNAIWRLPLSVRIRRISKTAVNGSY
jgi:hypothetical protein